MSSTPTEQSELERAAARYERLLEVQSLMAQVSRELGPAVDLDEVLRVVLAAMRSLVHCDGVVISLAEGDELVTVAMDPPATRGAPVRFRASRTMAGQVLRTGVSVLSGDLPHDERLEPGQQETARRRDVASYLCVPLVCLGDAIGVLQVYATEPDTFDEHHRVLAEGLATQVGGAIESARRYRMITQLEVLKSDFIARVSHELRTPITIMSGFVNTLLANHDRLDSDTRRRMLERVDTATARLSGLIDQLLMLSRMEAGVVAATSEVVAASAVLDDVRREAEHPEAVQVDCPATLLLTTDRALLVRALGYLVDNALKYAGACTLRARDGVIEVVDEGPGIPPEHRGQVFERFTRANTDTTVAGMGIGLPMARTLLSAAGAELTVEDGPGGVGTRMVVRFP